MTKQLPDLDNCKLISGALSNTKGGKKIKTSKKSKDQHIPVCPLYPMKITSIQIFKQALAFGAEFTS